MVGIVIVTHLKLGEELLAVAELIVGKLKQFQAVSINPKEGVEEIKERISEAIRRVDKGKGILILTDMFGGTPSNICLSFLGEWKIEVITGVNLPMLLKLATSEEERDLAELADFIRTYGQKNINLASEILKKNLKGK
ncbi:MAG: PTS sugar transporter subunit IIA [Deltaproteobacteria bacterium]|nr:PTS sugar transporter subunit IIA [Deltaproteobacteria bacterium]